MPPLLLIGLKKDKYPVEYVGNVSIYDQIFFYILIGITVACVGAVYQISPAIKVSLLVILLISAVGVYLFRRDALSAKNKEKVKYEGFDVWLDLFFVLIIVFFIRTFILSPFQIIGPSMESTFHGGTIQ